MSQSFFEAIRAGDREKVSALLSADASLLAAKDEKGLGVYATARYSGRSEVAALLLEKGVELDIFAACMAGTKERLLQLIDEKPERVSEYSPDGWTPLHLACFFGQPELAAELMARGAEVNARSRNPMENTALHAAAAGRDQEAVCLLIEHGADVNARQHGGWTALHAASQNGDVEMVRLLIGAGADVGARAENQQSALDLAMTKGHQTVVDVLDEFSPVEERGASGAS